MFGGLIATSSSRFVKVLVSVHLEALLPSREVQQAAKEEVLHNGHLGQYLHLVHLHHAGVHLHAQPQPASCPACNLQSRSQDKPSQHPRLSLHNHLPARLSRLEFLCTWLIPGSQPSRTECLSGRRGCKACRACAAAHLAPCGDAADVIQHGRGLCERALLHLCSTSGASLSTQGRSCDSRAVSASAEGRSYALLR